MTGVLHAATAARPRPDGGATIAAVLRWNGNAAPKVVVRRLRDVDATVTAYQALLLGLREARRASARALVLYSDNAEVVGQLNGAERSPASTLGLYLQTRALLNAFRSAEVRHVDAAAMQEAVFAAAAAFRAPRPVYADLPLWTMAS